jgi:hypothetical protein
LLLKNVELFKKIKCENVFVEKDKNNNYFLYEILEKIMQLLGKKDIIFIDSLAFNKYMALGKSENYIIVNCIKFLSVTAKDDIIELYELLLKQNYDCNILSVYNPGRELNDYTYNLRVKINEEYIIIASGIYLTSCTPFKKFGKYNYCGIDYLKYDLYYDIVYNIEGKKEEKKCILKQLEIIQNKYYKENNKTEFENSPFQRLITKCKGEYINPQKKSILDRFFEKEKRKQNIKKIYKDGYKLIKIPDKEISQNCKGKTKEDCEYPCEFFNDKCRDHRNNYMTGNEEDY